MYALVIVAFLCVCSVQPFTGKSHIKPRSAGANIARDYAGINRFLEQILSGEKRAICSLSVAYQRSYAHEHITRYFLGDKKLFITGSRISNRNDCDILADYFGLPFDFRSIIRLEPRVYNVIVPMMACIHFNETLPGFFLTLTAPLQYTSWKCLLDERVIQPGIQPFPAGYMSDARISRADLVNKFSDVVQEQKMFGDLVTPICYGMLSCKLDQRVGIADIACNLEYSWFCDRRYNIVTGARVVIPTGNRSRSRLLFEAIIGNEGHWELGATAHGRYDLWHDRIKNRRFSFCTDLFITHMFCAYQHRSFDLCNGHGSRYMLLQKMGPAHDTITLGDHNIIQTQYKKELIHAINLTTQRVKIGVGLHVDGLIKIAYQHNRWNFDLGYNGWYRHAERVKSDLNISCINGYALKGDGQLYGYRAADAPAVALNATQKCATIHAGQGAGNTLNNFVNSNADKPKRAAINGQPLQQSTTAISGILTLAQVHGSHNPHLLHARSVDISSGCVPRSVAHKVFGHVGYTRECQQKEYMIGVGLEGSCTGGCVEKRGILSEWGVWLKGLISF